MCTCFVRSLTARAFTMRRPCDAQLDRDSQSAAGQGAVPLEGYASVYADVSGLLPWQLASRVLAGLKAHQDIDRLNDLKRFVIAGAAPVVGASCRVAYTLFCSFSRLRDRLASCSEATWGANGTAVLSQLAVMLT